LILIDLKEYAAELGCFMKIFIDQFSVVGKAEFGLLFVGKEKAQ